MSITRLNSPKLIDSADKSKEQFKNLVKQLPAEATGIYLAGVSFFHDDVLWLSIAAVIGLLILIWLRQRAKVSRTIWLTSVIGYVIWVYTIGDGPFQAIAGAINMTLPEMLGAFLVTVYSTVVTILAINPPRNG